MKKIITILIVVVCITTVKAQTYVTIPDANFVTWLQAELPTAMNGNQMDITDPAVTMRTRIDVENLGIADLTGIQYFDSLKILDCGNGQSSSNPNNLTSLPLLPSTLDTLICGRNAIVNLPVLPNTLIYLGCYNNLITSIPLLPNGLTFLNCSVNQLTSLPTLPGTLNKLDCSNNPLGSLPSLPNSLIELVCVSNGLSNLPTLPNSITFLYCDENPLFSLPTLPSSLEYLLCASNQLTSLPTLPSQLLLIECSFNSLNNLPPLPNSLTYLNCRNNQLTSLPVFPNTLTSLNCSNNNISCFPVFPSTILNNDPFNISNNPFTCLPNYISAMDAATLNYPLCVSGNTVTNPNGCSDAEGIAGYTYKDNNSSCLKDGGDTGLKNIPMQIYDNAANLLGQTYTALNGVCQFPQTMNTYTVSIDTMGLPFMASCIDPGVDSTVYTGLLTTDVNFALTCKPGFDVGIQSIVSNGLVFPGQMHELNVHAGDMTHWYNLSCASGVSGTISFSVNGPVTYIGPAAGALNPIVTGNIYTYTIADFGAINNTSDFRLVFQTHPTAQAGDAICVNATVTPISGDNVPLNNTYEFCYLVTNSHDPNIKEVYPIAVQPGFNDWLTYTIHFQNTGNAAAINIRLEDTLDNRLDPETFQVLNYSHSNTIDLTGHHLTVRYPNIQLADSTSNPLGSIGFIQYRIKPKTGWVTDTIKNKVAIYFDYNAPVITNTAKSYFMLPTTINELMANHSSVNLLPNPTNGLLTVQSPYEMKQIEVSNIAGQLLLSERIGTKTHQLQLQNFAEGIYFVKVVYANGISVTKKVVKQ